MQQLDLALRSADHAAVTRRAVTVLFGIAGVLTALYMLWIAVDGLSTSSGDTWFDLIVLATVPLAVGTGYLLPEFAFARDSTERTCAVAGRFWSACQAAFLWLLAIAIGVEVAGWTGAFVGGAVGGILAWQSLDSMHFLRQTVELQGEPVPATSPSPTRPQIARLVGKTLLVWVACIAIVAGASYAVFGQQGAVVATLLGVILIVVAYALAIYRWRRRHPTV